MSSARPISCPTRPTGRRALRSRETTDTAIPYLAQNISKNSTFCRTVLDMLEYNFMAEEEEPIPNF